MHSNNSHNYFFFVVCTQNLVGCSRLEEGYNWSNKSFGVSIYHNSHGLCQAERIKSLPAESGADIAPFPDHIGTAKFKDGRSWNAGRSIIPADGV